MSPVSAINTAAAATEDLGVSRPRVALALVGALAAGALGALPGTPAAAEPPPAGRGSAVMSPRLQALNASSDVVSARRAVAPGTPAAGPGSLLRHDAERYLVDIRVADLTPAVEDALAAAEALVTHRDPARDLVTAAIRPDRLDEVARVDGVEWVADILTPITHAACPGGAAISAGDGILGVDDLRAATGVDGTGVTVGVLSDSYNRWDTAPRTAAQDVASGDLPGATNPCGRTGPVGLLDDSEPGYDEGRAMAQIVHDLAPGAGLSFATAFAGEGAFAANIEALAAAGADVIVDDVGYFEEPFFQPGVIDRAITNVTAAGVQYFSAAGNSNVVLGNQDVGSYEAPAYRPTPCPVMAVAPIDALTDCHDFDAGAGTDSDFTVTLKPGRSFLLDLQWAEPYFGVTDDIDLYLLDPAGNVLERSIEPNLLSERPVEILYHANETASPQDLRVVVGRYAGTAVPRMKFVFFGDEHMFSAMDYTTGTGGDVIGPTIVGHSGGPQTISVAARSVLGSAVDEYSSRGPVTHYFGPVDGTTPAAALDAPLVLAKPDLTASDCGVTTFFASAAAPYRFCGTSAAAPHAAAVAALLRGVRPGATPGQLLSALTSTATDQGVAEAVEGAGLIDAAAAGGALLAAVGSPSSQTITFDAPASGLAGTSTALSASASSGLPVTITVDATSTAVCSVAGSTVTFLTGGTCTLRANQGGNLGWNAAPEVSEDVAVTKRGQTISFVAPGTASVGTARVLSASASSGLGVILAVAPGSSTICTLTGSTVRYLKPGTCTITASQAGNAVFLAAPPVADSTLVVAARPTGSCDGRPATIVGTNGNDTLRGTSRADVIDARGGHDRIVGRGGNDIICGGDGNDTIYGAGGQDRLHGGAGRDSLDGGAGRDICKGGPGRDSTRSC